ncbi:glycoside hydrolase family 3 N-terminal domain-containing protein [Tamlana sp. 2_MG-2023]|uniref:glycoside hydrolase family 3 N-terminal domain-containing protein n=1 Tax=unclassified Tamlana TaxID=2614803 RepID=UPI0026E265C0|nr:MULTISPECIES: glycoside hydrolase family 3 N-terminal domain-containing protein [unclassified Tamlana]MDO6760001.1 glycoside hydrolase family 3 N-terminal domain-containing protein [Tamlana sp. 2_MG-2023]MDO6791829.1 glycoside hydrolase family 3 N-terminal domain-containing protein [Tamlana sp. 1_MG-2023]
MNRIIKSTVVALLLLISYGCNTTKDTTNKNEQAIIMATPFDAKIDSLMDLMTLKEKIGQTVMYSGDLTVTGPVVSNNNQKYVKEGVVGAMLNVFSAKATKDLQKIAVEETRLGIPLLFGYDVIHGYKTIFPINLGLAASWDLEDIKKGSRIAAEEASAVGIHWTFAPMVDISRDPRWGRISESAGEDVYLASQIGKAYVEGFQGEDLSKHNTILACAKHFVGYGAAQAGRDYHTVNMGEDELRNVYLPPFKATVEAGVETFMTAFNELNGIPATGNKYIFRDILKDEWNFKGFVVTDYFATNEMVVHGYAKDRKEAAKLAIEAGVDQDMMSNANHLYLEELVNEGEVDVKLIDDACRRVLLTKYKLGLFEDPYKYSDEQREKEVIYKPEFLEAARQSAAMSSVLLKNNVSSLPLNKTQTIALIGPLAKDKKNIIGNWAAEGDRNGKAISIHQGIQEYLSDSKIIYAKGCDIEGADDIGFGAAIDAAKKADKIVMVLGESYEMSGEAASRTNIKLPGRQTDLIKAIRKEVPNKKIILVLMNGRPLDLSEEDILVDTILETWFPGTSGGYGVADVLFGAYNPSGKLPVTFPRNVGQIPLYYNMKRAGRPMNPDNPKERYTSNYLDSPNSPLYAFGHGLSYTDYKYSDIKLSANTIGFSDTLTASVTVTNTGEYDGHEVVQLYIHDKVGSLTRPVKELKGFQKIFLKKGESKTVKFDVTIEDLKYYNASSNFDVEPGEFEIAIKGSSDFNFENTFRLE